jgi:hypothetical protein
VTLRIKAVEITTMGIMATFRHSEHQSYTEIHVFILFFSIIILSAIMLSVKMLSIFMLNVIILNAECYNAEYHHAVCRILIVTVVNGVMLVS